MSAAIEIAERRLGATDIRLPVLGFGAAPIGNLYTEVTDDEAMRAIGVALEKGIRYFDTAPYYGYGLSESRLGQGLKGVSRDSVRISTKVGRRIYEDTTRKPGQEGFAVAGYKAEFDYSRDGVMRSFESSLKRLGTDHVDILLLHDIGRLTHGDRHPVLLRQALDEALPAMAELKSSGACGAIGIGVNEEDIAVELLPLFPLDCVMLAGRYTLLEQHASRRIMHEAQARNVGILVAGPYSSGLMGDARAPGSTYNYAPVEPEVLQRAQRIYAICAEHGVDAGAAALQFPLAHPAVTSVVAGMRNTEEATSASLRYRADLPAEFWQRLRAEGLTQDWARTPE
ncbi:aldo/keto reductase [Pseudoxanthomonas sp. CF125]|jgi:D-threo-aldose 1-dehydrogenase|uniref:aldo/keto reductase n=1 Tax=Pseudoxanthomonas sp. CF125 TaxID=1855303 RepID=UPI0008816B85|nr:aldo/keto reductase [Pseudoxanthomonas sp. CF125]SDQ31587.1 D-threo-aldose 1-dehydrogenase [Pseudoxanthomonas sp. CF125]